MWEVIYVIHESYIKEHPHIECMEDMTQEHYSCLKQMVLDHELPRYKFGLASIDIKEHGSNRMSLTHPVFGAFNTLEGTGPFNTKMLQVSQSHYIRHQKVRNEIEALYCDVKALLNRENVMIYDSWDMLSGIDSRIEEQVEGMTGMSLERFEYTVNQYCKPSKYDHYIGMVRYDSGADTTYITYHTMQELRMDHHTLLSYYEDAAFKMVHHIMTDVSGVINF